MKANIRILIDEAIEQGVQGGLVRAFKHDDEPSLEYIVGHIRDAIWLRLDEVFTFDDVE